MIAAVLVALLAAPPSCLERMALTASSTRPTFATELECELWEGIVLLEGDLKTATISATACENKLALLTPEAVPDDLTGPPWWFWGLAIVAAAAGGLAAGYFLRSSDGSTNPIFAR